MKNCITCGKELEQHKKKCCSEECFQVYYKSHKNSIKQVYCLHCGKELNKKQIRYCSVDCRLKVERKTENRCYQCNSIMDKRHKKYCCKECHNLSKVGVSLSEETKLKIGKTSAGNTYRRGKKLTEEQKQKLSQQRRGIPKSKEWKIKMSVRQSGKNNSMFGTISPMKGRSHSSETKEKISVKNSGMTSPMKGKSHSQEARKKLRVSHIKRLEELIKQLGEDVQLTPNWNPKACDYFEQFDKDNNTSGQHARNGGEFYIKELGYWVDYINHDLKLIMEYDEKYHNNKKQKEKDLTRQNEIQELFSDYEFKRIIDPT